MTASPVHLLLTRRQRRLLDWGRYPKRPAPLCGSQEDDPATVGPLNGPRSRQKALKAVTCPQCLERMEERRVGIVLGLIDPAE